MNVDLANAYEEIDGLLAATLEIDDYVDLEGLKITSVEHPPFEPGPLKLPADPSPELVYPSQPELTTPLAPTGLSGVFGKKKHVQALEHAQAEHRLAIEQWQAHCQKMYDDYVAEQAQREDAEVTRERPSPRPRRHIRESAKSVKRRLVSETLS